MNENQAYYDSLLELFQSDGWNNFIEDMTASAEQVTLKSCSSADDFWKAKGREEVFDRLLSYENYIKAGIDAQNL